MPLRNDGDTAKNYVALGAATTVFMWSPTQRESSVSYSESFRSARSVYWKGVREHLEFTNDAGVAWKWRRVIFEAKSFREAASYRSGTTYYRNWKSLSAAEITALTALLFEGTDGSDWSNQFLAKSDTKRLRILYDRFQVIRNSNDAAGHRVIKQYIPLNRMMHYDEVEGGGTTSTSSYPAPDIPGLGNVYIVDFFQDIGASETETLTIRSNTTAYWHEK